MKEDVDSMNHGQSSGKTKEEETPLFAPASDSPSFSKV